MRFVAVCFIMLLSACQSYDDENTAMFNAIQSQYSQQHKATNDALADYDKCATADCRSKALERARYWNEREWESISQMRYAINNRRR